MPINDTQTIDSHSESETKIFAEKFAAGLHRGDVLALFGDLGYGKTTFVQGLAKGLGLEQKITSPTFTIIREYHKSVGNISMKLYHIDLYRIEEREELMSLGLEEILNGLDSIVVIEWPEKMGDLLPEKRISITFEYIDENTRSINIKRKYD